MPNDYLKIYFFIIIVLSLLVFFYYQNNNLEVSKLNYKNDKVPKAFDNFKIIHISDLHNKRFGSKQFRIIKKIKKENPDVIFITGDLVDRRRFNLNKALEFIDSAIEIAPIYYIAGNHEAWSFQYPNIKKELLKRKVTVLDNDIVNIEKDKSQISVAGIKDAAFDTEKNAKEVNLKRFKKDLKNFKLKSNFNILLSHRPEIFDLYAKSKFDLIFCGHAHGGQFRLPIIGGLFSPNQGILPKYTSGRYDDKNTTMIVSRGLGNSLMPIRLFNKPEIVSVTFKKN